MAQAEFPSHTRRKRSWLGRVLLWCTGIVVVLVIATAIATPWILRAAVPEIFARLSMQASVTGGSLSLLRRELTLNGFVLGAPDAPALSVGELGVGLEVSALIDGRIKLRHLRVKDISMNAQRLLAFRLPGDRDALARRSSLPVELDELALEDVRLVSLGERIGQDVHIIRLEVKDLDAFLAGKDSSVDLQGAIGDGKVNVQLNIGRDGGKLRATGKYQVDKAPVHGWAGLGSEEDPLSEGAVSGRGDIRISYAFETTELEVILDGRARLAGLGVDIEALKASGGDADWQGRLAIHWSQQLGVPTIRGEGSLDVETLQLASAQASSPPIQATISDISWHGDFDWRNGFRSEGAVLGTKVEVTGASSTASAWRSHAEDFSWRLRTQPDAVSGKFTARMQNIDVARFSMSLSDADAPVDIVVEKLAVDTISNAPSGDVVLGQASVETLAVTRTRGWNAADAATYRVDGLTAKDLRGDFSGKLHGARLSAESLDYSQSARRVRAEEIQLARIDFSVPAGVAIAELGVKSMRADEGKGDVWLSGLKAASVHGDADGSFGADSIEVTQAFQNAGNDLSWEFSRLKLRGLQGRADDTARAAAIYLGEIKVSIAQASWRASGLGSTDVLVSADGNMSVAGFALEELTHHHPSVGEVRIAALDANGLRAGNARAEADGVKAASVTYSLPDGNVIETHDLAARGLAGGLAGELKAEHFSIARGDGRFAGGGRLNATALVTRGLSVATDGGVAVAHATLERVSHGDAAAATLDLDNLAVTALHWAPGAPLSAGGAVVGAARFSPAEGASWHLAELAARNFSWDGSARIGADSALLASVSQVHGASMDWRAQGLRATKFQWAISGDVQAAMVNAESVHGGPATIAWKVASVSATELRSSADHGQKVDSLETGAIAVTDEGNGAMLSIQRVAIAALGISTLTDVSAEQLRVFDLRLRSDQPDWPSRLVVAELRLTNPLRRFDGMLDLGQVVAWKPYLIVAESKDNDWLWPPLPGVNHEPGDHKGDVGAQSKSGFRMTSFITRGPGRVAFMDRATDPVFHISLDPVVVAMENLDTLLPGNLTRLRARATGTRFSAVRAHGELRKRVAGFDTELKVLANGAYAPILNPYIAQHEAIAITAGRVDARNDIRIEDGELTGQAELLLSGIEVVSTSGAPVLGRFDPASFPLRTALALLRDRQGNISITVPFKARTEDPEFDFVDDFQKDFVSTLTTAGQVAANLPGKTVDRTVRLFENTVSLLPGVSTERYLPVEFAYGADDFTARPLVYLDRLGKHMGERDALELALCGRAVTRDGEAATEKSYGIDALFAEASKGVYPVYEPGRDGLLALAKARADIVRRYLRDIHHIPEGRLAACEAQIDEADGAKPRVDLQVKTPAKSKGLFGLFP